MDTGAAAVLAALIGAVATVTVAIINTRAQTRPTQSSPISRHEVTKTESSRSWGITVLCAVSASFFLASVLFFGTVLGFLLLFVALILGVIALATYLIKRK